MNIKFIFDMLDELDKGADINYSEGLYTYSEQAAYKQATKAVRNYLKETIELLKDQ